MPANLIDALAGAAAVLALPFAAIGLLGDPSGPTVRIAETVLIDAPPFDYPLPGEFLANGQPAAAPFIKVKVALFSITRHQVGLADYDRCVAAGACAPADAGPTELDVPATGVSWLDADAYARWYSEATGETWRLPTAEEAAAAAGERFGGEAFSAAADDRANPAIRWIRLYREEAAASRAPDPQPKPRGHYGANSLGLEDFGGNVWEWTSTCYSRTALDPEGGTATTTENCGVRVLEGRHRATMSTFVRDGRSGGCAVGTPPDRLGFRLVRDDASATAFDAVLLGIRRALRRMGSSLSAIGLEA